MCTIRVEEELGGAIVHRDSEVVGNYRGIAIGSCVAKVFTRLLTKRLEYAEEQILMEAQGGFRAKRRCSEQVFILRGVCELR